MATALANLMFDNHPNRAAVRAAGGVVILVSLIERYSELGIAEQAAAALANLCYDSDANRDAVVDAGGARALRTLCAAQPGSVAAVQAQAALDLLARHPSSRPSVSTGVEAAVERRAVGLA